MKNRPEEKTGIKNPKKLKQETVKELEKLKKNRQAAIPEKIRNALFAGSRSLFGTLNSLQTCHPARGPRSLGGILGPLMVGMGIIHFMN